MPTTYSAQKLVHSPLCFAAVGFLYQHVQRASSIEVAFRCRTSFPLPFGHVGRHRSDALVHRIWRCFLASLYNPSNSSLVDGL